MEAVAAVRSRLQVAQRRAQLLQLGVRLFATRAYDEVSIDTIAEEAGVSKGLLYHYFGGKRAYYLATIGYSAAQLVRSFRAIPADVVGPARAGAALSAYLDFVEEHGNAYATFTSGGLGSDPEVAAVLERTRTTAIREILTNVGLEEPRPTFELAVRHFIGGVEATALDWHQRRHLPREDLLAFWVEQIAATIEVAVTLDPQAPIAIEDV